MSGAWSFSPAPFVFGPEGLSGKKAGLLKMGPGDDQERLIASEGETTVRAIGTEGGESMSIESVKQRWENRRAEYARLNAQVNAEVLTREFLQDLEAVQAASREITLTLSEASRRSGYHRDTLARLIRDGRIPNAGRKHAPRIRCADLPRRPKSSAVTSGHYDAARDARAILLARQ
jgi:hypothetical protein